MMAGERSVIAFTIAKNGKKEMIGEIGQVTLCTINKSSILHSAFHHPFTKTLNVVPCPTALSSVNMPPNSAARSAMLVKPR